MFYISLLFLESSPILTTFLKKPIKQFKMPNTITRKGLLPPMQFTTHKTPTICSCTYSAAFSLSLINTANDIQSQRNTWIWLYIEAEQTWTHSKRGHWTQDCALSNARMGSITACNRASQPEWSQTQSETTTVKCMVFLMYIYYIDVFIIYIYMLYILSNRCTQTTTAHIPQHYNDRHSVQCPAAVFDKKQFLFIFCTCRCIPCYKLVYFYMIIWYKHSYFICCRMCIRFSCIHSAMTP